ncbi:polyprotein pp220 [Elysia marginata]|uniref:Polyprotein pp220 n=1 Tax=Elysia marginata TaxID=1093978 RepID=A0AAV4GTV8_9GAST|nr:polyprotein pp220 [Elysia marginata]
MREAAAPIPNNRTLYGADLQFGALTFIAQPDAGDLTGATALKQVQLGENAQNRLIALETIGKARFDTRIVRNLFFITNIQRIMRLKLNQELTQYRNVLVSNHSVVNPGVTEYGYIPPSSATDPRLRQYGPGNETSSDRRYDNETRIIQ